MILVCKYWKDTLIPNLSFQYYLIENKRDLNLLNGLKNRYGRDCFDFKVIELTRVASRLLLQDSDISTTVTPLVTKYQTLNPMDLVSKFTNVNSLVLIVDDSNSGDINGTIMLLRSNTKSLQKLVDLDIRFSHLPLGTLDLRNTIDELPNLESLKCTYFKDLTPMSSSILPLNFSNKSVSRLFLKKMKITCRNIQDLLNRTKTLTHLTITNLLESDMDAILVSLTSTNKTITYLSLELNTSNSVDCTLVRNLLLKNKVLQTCLLFAKLNPPSLQQPLPESLTLNDTLTDLSIYNFEMISIKFSKLVQLSINSTIQSVDRIMESLESPSLKSLSLFYSSQSTSTKPLIDLLNRFEYLQTLILKGSNSTWNDIINSLKDKSLQLNYLIPDTCISPITLLPPKQLIQYYQECK
ncbi:hypothetical protein DLAC_02989 [Tieghemostelium lacteum]|uniref:Uncharacterized protein n=1 Tax=Tieghemostelium lacteum TaxID=361077 RepID=A0A152A3Y0_TIELA|nr:hypothetical protein DLAC_02989 [Tieghemostelium lacteum]|eukprot:KYR00926.1 hypothetical protein DLAC_02989 [Tieghemostelium lacteum]